MSEVSCENCQAACCKGRPALTMQLSSEEAEFMRRPGNLLQTIAEPANYDRSDVIYPISMQVYPEKNTFQWIVETGREYEPLSAGYGRYALLGACKYLVADENGRERCGVYEDRPEVCRKFEMRGRACRLMRVAAGIDAPEDYVDLRDLLR
jgi:Fe-S-cluster containining protein